jgi:DNA (cytosine-5)-methyltransferase 1
MTFDSEISIDCFAGGGGASCGIALATGQSPAVAINHWATALSVHAANHPDTHHVTEDVWAVDPSEVVAGRPVGVAWFSPDCTHFSRAKSGKPRTNKIRGLAWSVARWAAAVAPRLIVVENVMEFAGWCPLDRDGNPIAEKKGQTFRAWVRRLQRLGYTVDWRVLAACDYGAPTTRRRLYVVARRGSESIRWPEPTHGPGRASPWRTAGEIIDWSIPIPSIFDRPKPLVDATLRRIARGIQRFVIDDPEPFLLTYYGSEDGVDSIHSPLRTVTARDRFALVAPYLVHLGNGERPGQSPRIYDPRQPLNTVVAGGVKQGLVAAYLARHFGGRGTVGSSLHEPARTVTAQDHHALVAAFLTKWYGTSTGSSLRSPVPTVTGGGEHLGIVTVNIAGETYSIADIGMRHLAPPELFAANGFPASYQIDRGADGRPITRTDQVRLAGNSVVQQVAAAVIQANTGVHLHLHSRGAHGRQESLWT